MCTQNTNKLSKGERTKQLTDLVCDSESWLPLLAAAGACFCEGVKIMHKITQNTSNVTIMFLNDELSWKMSWFG